MPHQSNAGGHGRGIPEHFQQRQSGGTMEAAKETSQEMMSAVSEQAQQAWETTREAASAVAETAGNLWGDVSNFMRRYPVATFLAGACVGALLASALRLMPHPDYMIRGMERSGRGGPYQPYGT